MCSDEKITFSKTTIGDKYSFLQSNYICEGIRVPKKCFLIMSVCCLWTITFEKIIRLKYVLVHTIKV